MIRAVVAPADRRTANAKIESCTLQCPVRIPARDRREH